MTRWNRRAFLGSGLAALASDGDWNRLAEAFPVDRSILNFNHAGVGTTPRAVAEAVVRRMWDSEVKQLIAVLRGTAA
jgi:hypothetical protein